MAHEASVHGEKGRSAAAEAQAQQEQHERQAQQEADGETMREWKAEKQRHQAGLSADKVRAARVLVDHAEKVATHNRQVKAENDRIEREEARKLQKGTIEAAREAERLLTEQRSLGQDWDSMHHKVYRSLLQYLIVPNRT